MYIAFRYGETLQQTFLRTRGNFFVYWYNHMQEPYHRLARQHVGTLPENRLDSLRNLGNEWSVDKEKTDIV
jgi:hypothetical protein